MNRTLHLLLMVSALITSPAIAGTCSDLLVTHLDRLSSVAWLRPVARARWKLSNLDPYYVGEDVAKSAYHSELTDVLRNLPIHYFSEVELVEAGVIIRNGKLLRLDGSQIQNIFGLEYVMEPNGNILIMPHYSNPIRTGHRLKHSSLIQGGAVASAGHISLNEHGEVIKIDRNSGHYKPSRLQLKQFVDQLKGSGIDLSKAEIFWR